MTDLPPSGWYPDPERPGETRWWDGSAWGPSTTATRGDNDGYPELGAWLGDSFNRSVAHWRELLIVAAVTSVVSTVAAWIGFRIVIDDLRYVNEEVEGLGSLATAAPLFLLAIVASVVGYLAVTRIMLDSVDGISPDAFRALGDAFRVLPRFVGWTIALAVAATAVVGLMVGSVFVLPGPLVALLIVLLLVGVVFVSVRLAWLSFAVVDGPGAPFATSARVSEGRWWSSLGRMLLIGLVVGIVSVVVSGIVGAVGGGPVGTTGASAVEITRDANDDVVSIELADDVVDLSPAAVVFGVVGSVVNGVVVSGPSTAAFATLYRTRNRRRGDSRLADRE